MAAIDHLMWGAADLDAGVAEAQRLFGVPPVAGGSHPGLGTRNALLGLADGVYLEIIAPDPEQALEGNFGAALARLPSPALVTYAVAATDLHAVGRVLQTHGYTARGPVATRRTTPAGVQLAWQLLFPGGHPFGGLCPFFIDWGKSPHPSRELPPAGRLAGIAVGSPDAQHLAPLLAELGVPVSAEQAPQPWIRAVVETPGGSVTLQTSPSASALRFG